MTERRLLRLAILVFWTLFWGLSVTDKIIPDVQHLWVGKDFFALFIKFFASLGLKDPLFATAALALVSGLEAINFGLYLAALISFRKGDAAVTDRWFFRGDPGLHGAVQPVLHRRPGVRRPVPASSSTGCSGSSCSPPGSCSGTFRWRTARHSALPLLPRPGWVVGGLVLTLATVATLWRFSDATFHQVEAPVAGQEVVDGVYKFDFPFLADKVVWENTVNAFMAEHPELKVRYIYTGPSELNSKKKTHLLLYVFTEPA